jgi:hypothetical protein
LAFQHFNALSHCGAEPLIDPTLLPETVTSAERRKVTRWADAAKVLTRWTKMN